VKLDMPQELRDFFAEARRKAWKSVPKKQRKAQASKAARSYWAAMNPEQRSAEMKRRAATRSKRRKAKSPNA
jgi:hypothetical protein